MTELTPLAIRRITIDCKRVMELASEGMFWLADEENISRGHAIIFGCEGSPYYGGAFCFEVTFPPNYPFMPPSFNYLTNDGRTRFNPNLYKNGKVCLSLLNTWPGEPWSGVQSLSSILQSIQTAVLNPDALRNEPAYDKLHVHADIPVYDRIVQHATVETAILGYLKNPPEYLKPFYEAFKKHVLTSKPGLLKILDTLAAEFDGKTEYINFYHMSLAYKFNTLRKELEMIV